MTARSIDPDDRLRAIVMRRSAARVARERGDEASAKALDLLADASVEELRRVGITVSEYTEPEQQYELYDGEELEWVGPASVFVEMNPETADEIAGLAVGQSVKLGGGAAPVYELRRVR